MIYGDNATGAYGIYANQANASAVGCSISNFDTALEYQNVAGGKVAGGVFNASTEGMRLLNSNGVNISGVKKKRLRL